MLYPWMVVWHTECVLVPAEASKVGEGAVLYVSLAGKAFCEPPLTQASNGLPKLHLISTGVNLQEFIDFLEQSEEEYRPFWHTRELPEEHSGKRFGIDTDCPIFPGLFNFCKIYAGASVGANALVNCSQGPATAVSA
jgi:acetoin utilization deacetylase AcuC-like enzyme